MADLPGELQGGACAASCQGVSTYDIPGIPPFSPCVRGKLPYYYGMESNNDRNAKETGMETTTKLESLKAEYRSVQALCYNASQMRNAKQLGRLLARMEDLERQMDALRRSGG